MNKIFRNTKSFLKLIAIYSLILSIFLFESFLALNLWKSLILQKQKSFYEICLKFYKDLLTLIKLDKTFDLILKKLEFFQLSLFSEKINQNLNLISKIFLNHFVFLSLIIPLALYEIEFMPKLFFHKEQKEKKIGIFKGFAYFFVSNIIFSTLFTSIEIISNKFNKEKIFSYGTIIFISLIFLIKKIDLIDFLIKDIQQGFYLSNHNDINHDIKKENNQEIKPIIGPCSIFIAEIKDLIKNGSAYKHQ